MFESNLTLQIDVSTGEDSDSVGSAVLVALSETQRSFKKGATAVSNIIFLFEVGPLQCSFRNEHVHNAHLSCEIINKQMHQPIHVHV